MIFVGGGVTVEGNGTQPVDVQTVVFRPEDDRLAIRLETVAGPVQPHRDERQRQFAPGGVVHRLRQAVVAVADAAVQPVAVEDGNQLIQRAAGNGGEIQPRRTVGRGYLIEAVRSGDAGEADLFVAVEPAAGQAVGVVFRFVGGFGFFFEVVFVNGGLALFFVDVRQRDFPPLLVDIKKAVGGADKAHGEGQRPALTQPAVARLVGIVAALPDQR